MGFEAPATLPLWGKKWPREALVIKYEEGPREFRRGFQMDPMSDDERKLPHFEGAVEAGRGVTVAQLLRSDNRIPRFMGVDPGGDSRPGSALMALGLGEDGSRIPLAIKYGKWGPREFAEAAVQFYLTWMPWVVYVENDGLQKAYQELIVMLPGSPVVPLKGWLTSNKKTNPEIGIEGLDAEFIQGRWRIPSGEFYHHDVGCRCDWCRWRAEVMNYPNYTTSDGLMAMWFAWNALRKGEGSLFTDSASVDGMETFGSPVDTEVIGEAEDFDEFSLDNALKSWDIY
jgi:hypothetical protein